MRKFELVFKKLAKFRSDMRNSANSRSVKELIGDSIYNNRTVTVNQAIRYLDYTGQTTATNRLITVYEILRPMAVLQRQLDGKSRTDAIDLDELVWVYRQHVMDAGTLRRTVANSLRGI